MAIQEKDKWMGAMVDEMESLKNNETWDHIQLPRGNGAIGCKWVYKKKSSATEKLWENFKARLVAKGYSRK